MRVTSILTLAVLMAVSVSAYGGAKETAARAEYDEGTTAYNLGHFDDAAARYEAAYKLVHDPNMLFNIAQSYRLGGKYEQALPVFRAFLREAPADAQNRGLAEKFVEELKRKIEESKALVAAASPPPEAKPAVVPAPATSAPVPGAPVPAPTPTPEPLAAPSAPAPQPVVASVPAPEPDAESPVHADLLGQPSQPEPAAEAHPFYKTWWFWTAVGTAVVAGTVTAFLLTRSTPDSCNGLDMKCTGVK